MLIVGSLLLSAVIVFSRLAGSPCLKLTELLPRTPVNLYPSDEFGPGGRLSVSQLGTFDTHDKRLTRDQLVNAAERLQSLSKKLEDCGSHRISHEGCISLPAVTAGVGGEPTIGKRKNCTTFRKIEPSSDFGFQKKRFDRLPVPCNGTEAYDVWICERNDLTGTLRVRNRLCARERSKSESLTNVIFTKDPKWDKLVRALRGRDEFEFLLVGPEIVALGHQMRPVGECIYETEFSLNAPGWYRVDLFVTRRQFVGAHEIGRKWLESHDDDILGSETYIEFKLRGSESRQVKRQTLPLCDFKKKSEEFGVGSWVHKHESKVLDRIPRGSSVTYPDLANYEWRPRRCKLRRLTSSQVQECFRHRHIRFYGDSHMRRLFAAVGSFVCGASSVAPGWNKNTCVQNCANLKGSICVVHDPHGLRLPQINLTQIDLAIGNIGNHFLSGGKRTWTGGFVKKIESIIKAIKRNNAADRHRNFLWHDLNDFPAYNTPWLRAHADARTHTNTHLWTLLARNEVSKEDMVTLPSFDSTVGRVRGGAGSDVLDPHVPISILQRSVLYFILDYLGCG